MKKQSKHANANTRTVRYSHEEYSKDIRNGVGVYIDSIKMISRNSKVIARTLSVLQANTTLAEDIRLEYTEVLEKLTELTHKSIDDLEVINAELIEVVPSHLPSNDLKVVEWNLAIQDRVMTTCSWVAELTPVYVEIITALEKSGEPMVATPESELDVPATEEEQSTLDEESEFN